MFESAKESNKTKFDSYSVRNSVFIISHITFRIVACTCFFDNLSRNSCIQVWTGQSAFMGKQASEQFTYHLSLGLTSEWRVDEIHRNHHLKKLKDREKYKDRTLCCSINDLQWCSLLYTLTEGGGSRLWTGSIHSRDNSSECEDSVKNQYCPVVKSFIERCRQHLSAV